MNPYNILDVPKDADRAAVRRAYKRAAKRAHPDAGGSAQKFALVKLAHDILTDEARRERFDRTGDASEATIDNAASQAMQMVHSALDEALARIEKEGRDPAQVADLLAMMKAAINRQITSHEAERRALTEAIETNKRIAGRFKAKNGENRIKMLVEGRIRMMQEAIEHKGRAIGILKQASAIVDDHTYKADPEPRRQDGVFVMQFADLMNTAFSR
jgi:curved DNA-binding protein CbpA